MVTIFCKNNNTSKTFPEGLSLMEMLASFDFEQPYPILAAKVNNVCQGLKYRAFNSREVEFLDYTSYAGRSVYFFQRNQAFIRKTLFAFKKA